MINVVMFVAACVLSFFAHDAYHDSVRRARSDLRRARFGRWRATRSWSKARKQTRRAASDVNSAIACAEGDFAAASTAGRQYKDFFEELDAKYQGSNLRARARRRADLASRLRDRRVAELRHGGELTPEPTYDAAKALLLKPELVDEMSKEKKPAWHKEMWVVIPRENNEPEPPDDSPKPRPDSSPKAPNGHVVAPRLRRGAAA